MNYNDWVDNAVAITSLFPLGTKEIITEVKLYYINKDGNQKLEKTVKALWDTGAQCSTISLSLEEELNLTLVSTQRIVGVNCIPKNANVYVVDLSFHKDRIIKDVRVAACGRDSKFSMIIGMDIIRGGDFSLGTTTHNPISGEEGSPFVLFSFAHPSSEDPIDYVDKIMRGRKVRDQSPKNAEDRKKYQANKTKTKKNRRKRKH